MRAVRLARADLGGEPVALGAREALAAALLVSETRALLVVVDEGEEEGAEAQATAL